MRYSDSNSITENTVIYNDDTGIFIQYSCSNTLRNNVITDNEYNFGVLGSSLDEYTQDIDTSNTISGKPIYYLVGESNDTIPSDAGFIGLIDSSYITIQDLTLTNNYSGILLAYTSNSTIQNVDLYYNEYGIYLLSSDQNTLDNNDILSNKYGIFNKNSTTGNTIIGNDISYNESGIMFEYSDGNEIRDGNTITFNDKGIYQYGGSSNTVNQNIITDNGEGIRIMGSSNTITYNDVMNNEGIGIYLGGGSNTINNNTVSNNGEGIYIYSFLGNNSFLSNTITDNIGTGFYIYSSIENTLTDNTFSDNGDYNISISRSSNNTLDGNSMTGNLKNLSISGSTIDHYIHDIDTSNTINTKPIYYLIEASTQVIDSTSNAGYIGIINSDHITVKDLTLTNNNYGILFINTSDSSIENVNISNNANGIYLWNSDRNTVTLSTISDNDNYGISLSSSDDNSIITENTISGNDGSGLSISSSNNNDITDNTISDNGGSGILNSYSDYNTYTSNTISNNDEYGIYISSSTDNTMTNNEMTDNLCNFDIKASTLEDYTHEIDTSNTVDEKPIYYLFGAASQIIDSSSNAGYVAIINSIGIKVKDLTFTNQNYGLVVAYSSNCIVVNIIVSDNKYDGIYLTNSHENYISGCTTTSNDRYGIYLYDSDSNVIINNNTISDNERGISLFSSEDNVMTGNTITDFNESGIYATGNSNSNTISGNTISTTIPDCWSGISIYTSSHNLINDNIISNDSNGYNCWFGIRSKSGYSSTISGNTISGNNQGLSLLYSSSNTISENTISDNENYGLYLSSSDNATISGNNIYGNGGDGIYLYRSQSTLTENIVTDNTRVGINIRDNRSYTLRNNAMSENTYNLHINGSTHSEFIHDIDESNTVNGKPIYYWIDHHNETVPSDAGYVALIDSNNITVQDLTLTNNHYGLHVWNSSFITIQNMNITNNFVGVSVRYSNNITINENNISNNIGYETLYGNGISISRSNDNTITNNIVSNNSNNSGIQIYYSDNNNISDNEICENERGGMYVSFSDFNIISGNIVSGNDYHGIKFANSNDNTVTENTVSDNYEYGVYLSSSNNNTFYYNNILNNTQQFQNYSSTNTWDNGTGKGNYWSDYTGLDDGTGGRTIGDGVGDTNLPHNEVDNYPLIFQYGDVYNSNKNINYHEIQIAVNDADDGDIITVGSGTYYENVIVNKPLTINGSDNYSTKIDGGGLGNAISVVSNNVTVNGFDIVNHNNLPFIKTTGIKLDNVQNCNIINNRCSYAYYGIHLYLSNQNTITNNILFNNSYGIYQENSPDNTFSGNIYKNNTLGQHIDPSDNNIVTDNIYIDNYIGIFIEDSDYNTISGNTLSDNEIGIFIDETSTDNEIYYNNLLENETQATDSGTNTWDDGAGTGNFWSDYTGSDSDGDGIGDTPHIYDENPIIEPPSNTPPLVDIGGPYEVYESTEILFDASGSVDYNDEDILQYRWDLDGDGVWEHSWSTSPTISYTWYDEFYGTVILEVTDGEFIESRETPVMVHNMPPIITSWDGPIYPVDLNVTIEMTGTFTDPGTTDTHTAIIDWGDGTQSEGSIVDYTVSSTHAYSTIGVYTVKVTISDNDDGTTSEEFWFIAVYDSTEGHVTGGGWIDSPVGAYTADPTLTGKANFGFVSKYQKGKTIPTGNTEFQFHAGELNFHSDNYDWLVVAGDKAQFKGTGTINGEGEYKFIISAIDSDDIDQFRIRIWSEDEYGVETVIYDNGSDTEEGENLTEIGGGSIVIHKR
jgi:parallel beta-helix repeat protein